MTKQGIRRALLVLGSLLFGVLSLEAVILGLLTAPGLVFDHSAPLSRLRSIRGVITLTLRTYYTDSDRPIVQLDPACARYDPELTYTLRPYAHCEVASREYRSEYTINREGLRDDDAALTHPAIVVAGDSVSMGWGVAAAESFPKRLQQELGVPVLNAAISSYGTAREMALLKRLRLPGFPVLVIQYCDNDFAENKFVLDHGTLRITSEPAYRALAEQHDERRRYYPFKHSREFLRHLRLPLGASPAAPDTNADEARVFLDVLLRQEQLISGKTVVVVEVNADNLNDGAFGRSITALLDKPPYVHLKQLLHFVDISRVLTPDDYFVLDDHMRATGHAKVARLVAAEIARLHVLDENEVR